jgi:hypothetical protein
MSDELAIANVTSALKAVLSDAVGGADVTHTRPGASGNGGQSVNVFLYGVTPNASLRNEHVPTRRADGSVVQRPQTALDLHYLLSFYGDESLLEPQQLLGRSVRALQSTPTIGLPDSGSSTSPELVRLTPGALSLEELSKLWSVFFQTPYALSVAYEASVVLIEGTETPTAALPVRRRELRLVPFNHPFVEQVVSSVGPEEPIEPDSTLRIRGQQLRGEVTRVRLGGIDLAPTTVSATEIEVDLTAAPANALRAGVQGLQIIQNLSFDEPTDLRPLFESNVAGFVLHPKLGAIAPSAGKLTVELDPQIRARQRVVLLLSQVGVSEPPSFVFESRNQIDATSITLDVPGVAAGTYLVRVQVDGAETRLDWDQTEGSPTFGDYTGPTVTIP